MAFVITFGQAKENRTYVHQDETRKNKLPLTPALEQAKQYATYMDAYCDWYRWCNSKLVIRELSVCQ